MIAIVTAIVGAAAAFVLGYIVGKDKGYAAGMIAILEQQLNEEGKPEEEKKEIHPDCGWK